LANLKRGENDEPADQEGGSAARQTTGAGSTQAGGHTDPASASPAWLHPGRRQLPPERERCGALEWPSVGRGQRSSSGQAAEGLGRRRTYPCLRDQETRNTRSWAAVEEEGRLSATPNLQKNSGLGGHRRKKARSRKVVVEGKGSLKVDWPVKATRTERRRLPIRGQHVSAKRLGTTLPASLHDTADERPSGGNDGPVKNPAGAARRHHAAAACVVSRVEDGRSVPSSEYEAVTSWCEAGTGG
jgi:hypothetical protein